MSALVRARARVARDVRGRIARAGGVPRYAYTHYFVESEGLHSRIHLQNFYSTFWPEIAEPAVARVLVRDDAGRPQGEARREIPRFGSIFLELRELLQELGSGAREGTVAIDLEPAAAVRSRFHELPNIEEAAVKTPFWMAYYDGSENFMYVHSIETLSGQIFGAPLLLRWSASRHGPAGERWRSWRLLDIERLSELQVVCINHGSQTRSSTVGAYCADGATAMYERRVTLAPRALARVRVPVDELVGWAARHPETRHARVGLDPLMTANGKPYVIMRYADGPPSVHHG